VQDCRKRGHFGSAGKSALPGNHFVEHGSERKNVGASIDFLAIGLFRRHISDRAQDRSLFRERAAVAVDRFRKSIGFGLVVQLGEAEIENLHNTLRRDHHIRGLQIAMDNPRGVRGGKRVRNLRRIFHRRADAQALAPDQVIERFAGHVLHGDVMNRLAVDLLGVDVVDGDDVRVIQRRSSLRFLNKPLFAVATDGGGAQNLDRGRPVEARVHGFIHHTHSTGTEFGLDAIEAKCLADHERTFRG